MLVSYLNETKNKYKKVAHISEAKMRLVFKCFASDLTATNTAELTGISRPTINKIFNQIRERILEFTLDNSKDKGTYELDESYFGARRVRGKQGRGATGKTLVFGLLKREGDVSVCFVKKCSKEELIPII